MHLLHKKAFTLLTPIFIGFFSLSCGSKTVYKGVSDNDSSSSSAAESDGVNSVSDDALAGSNSSVDATSSSSQNDESKVSVDKVIEAKVDDTVNPKASSKDDNVLLGTPECASKDQSRSKLLSKTLSRELTDKALRYEIYALDCVGKAIEASHIEFDFNYGVRKVDEIPYKILRPDTEETVSSGILKSITGSDLYGNAGDDLFFYKTDKLIDFGLNAKLILSIDLSKIEFLEPLGSNDYDKLPTYLKIGDYKPHKEFVSLLEKECSVKNESRVSILTESLDIKINTPAKLSLDYELYSKDCEGSAITADEIRFDLNYIFDLGDGEDSEVTYSIVEQESSQTVSSGKLILIRGEDLFGNSGNHFFYFKTDQSFDFPSEWNKLKLNIVWNNVTLKKPISEDGDPNVLPSFIKFGQDLAPAKKDIKLNLIP